MSLRCKIKLPTMSMYRIYISHSFPKWFPFANFYLLKILKRVCRRHIHFTSHIFPHTPTDATTPKPKVYWHWHSFFVSISLFSLKLRCEGKSSFTTSLLHFPHYFFFREPNTLRQPFYWPSIKIIEQQNNKEVFFLSLSQFSQTLLSWSGPYKIITPCAPV